MNQMSLILRINEIFEQERELINYFFLLLHEDFLCSYVFEFNLVHVR